ncbi:DNA-binding transcriptional MerR regulator [Fontibacillus phaseoli]|uniref:DNA-binding transcriptional MerR regulator n=1 Tax=Fontibacillus phaseoli TaxID=1416533 RepID=A0A369BNB2_9BACL|nr:MerR family transcriptional regulator [Fontibacillus phaseoli]RCX23033.1 DNA-binding transcriptional MerR regulator [Fontibacillus phaseoli]
MHNLARSRKGGFAVFKIGEFSKLTQVSIRMLRYYDETGLLKPARIDNDSGYRYYSVEQISLLHKIIFLRDTGFTVSEIALAISNWESCFVTRQLRDKRQEIVYGIRKEQEKLKKIEMALRDIHADNMAVHCNVTLKSVPSYKVLSLRRIIPDYFSEGSLWMELTRYIEAEGLAIPQSSKTFAVYHDKDFKERDVDVEVCVVVDEVLRKSSDGFTFHETEQIDTMACALVDGPYENIGSAFLALARWLHLHEQYSMVGLNRQICHKGPWNEENPECYLTEIQIPVVKQK